MTSTAAHLSACGHALRRPAQVEGRATSELGEEAGEVVTADRGAANSPHRPLRRSHRVPGEG